MTTDPKQTIAVSLALLDARVEQLLEGQKSIIADNRNRNGRLEKLERAHELNVSESHAYHDALLERIRDISDPSRYLTEPERARLRAEWQNETATRNERNRVLIEKPYLLLGVAAVLSSPIVTLILKLVG